MYQESSDTGTAGALLPDRNLCQRVDYNRSPAAEVKYNSQVDTYSCRRLTQSDSVITLSRTGQRIPHAIK
jgi:hypothetical protein